MDVHKWAGVGSEALLLSFERSHYNTSNCISSCLLFLCTSEKKVYVLHELQNEEQAPDYGKLCLHNNTKQPPHPNAN